MPSFETLRFGDLAYRDEDIIRLPEGLLGMPDLRRWLILDMGDDVPLKWFQSLDRADFGFPVTEPYFYHDDYAVDVPDATRRSLGTRATEDLTTLIITTIHEGGEQVTGNLVAPLVLDTETRRGTQLILDSDRYSLRQDINYLKFGLAVTSDTSDNDAETVAENAAPAVMETDAPVPVEV